MMKFVLILAVCVFLSIGALAQTIVPEPEDRIIATVPYRAITQGPSAHWYGYYDKFQFDVTDRYVLGCKLPFEGRAPRADDAIELGMVDLQDGDTWIPLTKTTAWCWQQGCMLQWLPGSDSEVIYNVRTKTGYASVIQDVFTGEKRLLPLPIYTVSGDAKYAVSLNFARVGETRPGYGYNGFPDTGADVMHPEDDGIYMMDLETGDAKRIITLDQITKQFPSETTALGKNWFNHLLFNQDGSRFIFLHRWHKANARGWYTRGFTAAPDGSDIYCFNDDDMVSHFIWRDPKTILAWSREPELLNDRFYLYTDQEEVIEPVGAEVLKQDGHCTYSPDGQWICTDTYPGGNPRMQKLMLYRPRDGKLVMLAELYQAKQKEAQLRCDLHPRWSRDGKYLCIDSKASDQRQMYLFDISGIVNEQ